MDLVIRGGATISGSVRVPGDKSISHRALMLGSIASGRSVVRGLSAGEDVASTASCLRALGVSVEDGVIQGGAWRPPDANLDCGNSGTTMRLMAGLLAREPFESVLIGDASLSRRPMERVAEPLRALGAQVATTDGHAPVTIRGGALRGATVSTGVPSAQIKSAILLAALGADAAVTVSEPLPTRDHTERMLAALGVSVRSEGSSVTVEPGTPHAFDLDVPGDPSSAAFLLAAAVLTGGRVRVQDLLVNERRSGFLRALGEMGSPPDVAVDGRRLGDDVGIVSVERRDLNGAAFDAAWVPDMVDELPLIAVLATQADGITVVTGAEELRVKESDRIAVMCAELRKLGAKIEERPDGFEVFGPSQLRGATVRSHDDHRVAMALAVAGLVASGETRIEQAEAADVSWPGFADALREVGAECW